MGVYEDCAYESEGGGDELMLQCVADGLDALYEEQQGSYLSWFLVLCGALVFFMQVRGGECLVLQGDHCPTKRPL